MAEDNITLKCHRCGIVSLPYQTCKRWCLRENEEHDWMAFKPKDIWIHENADGIIEDSRDRIDLQLLIIDMGDSCVVKVEKGQLTSEEIKELPNSPWFYTHNPRIMHRTFENLKALIDASYAIESAPVPRIERRSDLYVLYLADGIKWEGIVGKAYDALSTLAGHPLPIYEPKRGEWMRLPSTAEYMGDPLESVGIAIWRYTKMK